MGRHIVETEWAQRPAGVSSPNLFAPVRAIMAEVGMNENQCSSTSTSVIGLKAISQVLRPCANAVTLNGNSKLATACCGASRRVAGRWIVPRSRNPGFQPSSRNSRWLVPPSSPKRLGEPHPPGPQPVATPLRESACSGSARRTPAPVPSTPDRRHSAHGVATGGHEAALQWSSDAVTNGFSPSPQSAGGEVAAGEEGRPTCRPPGGGPSHTRSGWTKAHLGHEDMAVTSP